MKKATKKQLGIDFDIMVKGEKYDFNYYAIDDNGTEDACAYLFYSLPVCRNEEWWCVTSTKFLDNDGYESYEIGWIGNDVPEVCRGFPSEVAIWEIVDE